MWLVIVIKRHESGKFGGLSNHLSNIINADASVRVAHGDLSARMSPSDPVEGRVTLYGDASAGNLGQNTNTSFIYLNKQRKCLDYVFN